MIEHPQVSPRKWTTQGGHWRPETDLINTQLVCRVIATEDARVLSVEQAADAKSKAGGVTSAALRNLRPHRERGMRGLVRRWMGWA